MKSILEEFSRRNISPEPRFFKPDSQYGRVLKTLSDSEEKLSSALSGELKETLELFIEAQAELNVLSCTERFIYGYRLGVLMTIDVYAGTDDLTLRKGDC